MAEQFTNKAIIVTGAGNGIGRASALAFAREGGSVAVADINEADGQTTVQQIVDAGGKAIFVHYDVSRSADVQRLVAATVTAFDGVDVLHNNAGVVKYGTVVDMLEEDWDWVLGVNLKGLLLTCKYAIPMRMFRDSYRVGGEVRAEARRLRGSLGPPSCRIAVETPLARGGHHGQPNFVWSDSSFASYCDRCETLA